MIAVMIPLDTQSLWTKGEGVIGTVWFTFNDEFPIVVILESPLKSNRSSSEGSCLVLVVTAMRTQSKNT